MQKIFIGRINGHFGRRLARIRKIRELSQSELGSRIGVSRTTIANLEGGKQNVQLHQVFELARALDTPAEELIPAWREIDPSTDAIHDKDQMFLALARTQLSSVLGGKYDE